LNRRENLLVRQGLGRLLAIAARDRRAGPVQGVAGRILDAVDEVRLDPEAAVREYRIARREVERRDTARAEGERRVARQREIVEAEALDVANGIQHARLLDHAQRSQIDRMDERIAQADPAVRPAREVAG